MLPLISTTQMRTAEAYTIANGVAAHDLVQCAGRAVAQYIAFHFAQCHRVVVCVGPGNNGADGIVVACELAQVGFHVTLFVWKRSPEDPWLQRVASDALTLVYANDDALLASLLDDADLVVDALLGIGANRPLADDLLALVHAMNQRPVQMPCVAVDVPTGCYGDGDVAPAVMVRADVTCATGPRKLATCFLPGLAAAGTVHACDIGLTVPTAVACYEATIALAAAWLPSRPLESYKGTFGTLCVWAGSAAYPGAATLCCHAALRTGTGIVSLATTHALAPLLWRVPELTLTLMDGQPLTALSDARFSAYLVGPGLGRNPETEALLTTFLRPTHLGQRHIVLDADALTLMSRNLAWYESIPAECAVLTPHMGELRRLCGGTIPPGHPVSVAQTLAARWRQVLVMKGSTTVIAAPDGTCFVWPHPNPVLAVGGSGDVLAGIIASLLAQGVVPIRAAVLAVVIHGLAAKQLQHAVGDAGILASEIIARIPYVLTQLRQHHD